MGTPVMPTLEKEQLLALYRRMLLIRRCEEQLARAHQRGLIHGACHTYIGQEAIAVGVCAHLTREDTVFSTHRGHGHALAKGVSPAQLIAELYGRASGCSRGRGGSMHLFAPEVDVLAIHGAADEAIRRARNGEGPTLLECRTYRTRPHAEGMGDFTYRTREEVEEWKTRCPILRLKQILIEKSFVAEAELTAIENA